MARCHDDILEIVLDVMEVSDHAFVFVVERKGGRHFTGDLLESGVGLDAFAEAHDYEGQAQSFEKGREGCWTSSKTLLRTVRCPPESWQSSSVPNPNEQFNGVDELRDHIHQNH